MSISRHIWTITIPSSTYLSALAICSSMKRDLFIAPPRLPWYAMRANSLLRFDPAFPGEALGHGRP
ncbi:hypothetical protein AR275_29480 [Stenotrophomonas maltophilia]|nr:hypothetical protein AR275_29480 [Stenotrophomonas maltophilia]